MKGRPRSDAITLRGRIDMVFYSSPRFSAGRLRTDSGERVSFTGQFLARQNDQVVLRGKWIKHPKYGRQFQVESLEYDLKLDAEGLANYLAKHPELKGIGPKRARIIAERYGDDFDDALCERAEEISKVARVPLTTILFLRDEWQRTRTLNLAFAWLAAFGLTHHQVTTLVDRLGNNVVGMLKENPYLIMDEVPGFGFRRVDQIALRIGVPKENEPRIRAGVLYCVDEALKQGDCWVDYEDLVHRANTMLVMDVLDSRDRIEHVLRSLLDAGELDGSSHCSRLLVARSKVLEMARSLSEWFAKARDPSPHSHKLSRIDHYVGNSKPRLTDGQRAAATMALSRTISVISGGAGTGKTTAVATITRICEQRGLDVILAAPTGKAAKRLEQVVGRPASTIHRLLGYDGNQFARGPDTPLCADVIVVDEVSMVDVPLAWQLAQAIDVDRTTVVLVGDHNQLPPVGPGNILRDLINTEVVPKVILDRIVRQAGVLKENSTAILRGEVRKTAEHEGVGPKPWILVNQLSNPQQVQAFLLEMFESVITERLGFDPLHDVQVLTPTHKGPIGVKELNIRLQRLLQKKMWGFHVPAPKPGRRPRLHVHDKVIQTRNNYDIDIMNGTMGLVVEVERNGTITVDFEGRHVTVEAGSKDMRDLELAYVLTVHRTQGSEFPCVVVVVHKSHSFMHHRNLLYTGVTRAKKTAVILGDAWGIRNCAQKKQVNNRNTFLSFFLAEASESMCAAPGPGLTSEEAVCRT